MPALTPLPLLTPAADPLIGARVGSFRIVRALGRGGMGSVYLAEHPAIGSKVAVKVLHEALSGNPDVVARFYDEARAVNLIGHENIVAIFDLSVLPPNRYYIVMEYLDGGTLAGKLQRGPVAPAVAVEILLQLCGALQSAHDRGVIHRDLKPDNVFLLRRGGRDAFVKLVDFGVAKLRDEASGSGHTLAGSIVGTPEYMAPEQCDNRPVDRRTDVYSLGIIAYELATGRLPFARRSIPQLLLAQMQERPPPPLEVNSSLPPALASAIERALAKNPDDRFPDMDAFAAVLRGALDRASPSPLPPGVGARREVHVELATPGAAARRLVAAEVSRASLFLRADADLPPLRSRHRFRIEHPELAVALEVEGEVVRHVDPADAASWMMPPGFAVQLIAATADARAALDRLGAALATGGVPITPTPTVRDDVAVTRQLAELEQRLGRSAYDLLGLDPGADGSDVRGRARVLETELRRMTGRRLTREQAALVPRLLDAIGHAAATLGAPGERLAYDLARKNHRGVARALAGELPAPALESRRRAWLAEHPDAAAEAQKHLSRAQVARALGNLPAALAACEAALDAHPLDPALHEAYRALAALPPGRKP